MLNLFRSKRAEETEALFWLIDLLILGIVIFLILQFIGKTGEATTLQKRVLAKDTALLIDTLYALPGNAYILYPHNTLWFGFEFKKNEVEVFEKYSDSPNVRERGFFIEDNLTLFEHKSFIPEPSLKPKKSFLKKYLPVFELLKQSKDEENPLSTLNLLFYKDSARLVINNREQIPSLHTVPCINSPGKIIKNVQFITDDNNRPLFDGKYLSFAKESTLRDKNTMNSAIQSLFVYISVRENSEINSIKIFYDADSSSRDLYSVFSCNLPNTLSGIRNDAGFASIPSNSFFLQKKLNVQNSKNAYLIMELSFKDSLTSEEWKGINNGMYSSISGMVENEIS